VTGYLSLKTLLLRALTYILLIFCLGTLLNPESNPSSADETFLKTKTPGSDFAVTIFADDKEDFCEDGSMHALVPGTAFRGLFFISPAVTDVQFSKISTKIHHPAEVYLLLGQFLI